MTRILFQIVFFLLGGLFSLPLFAFDVSSLERQKPPELPKPNVVVEQLSNGMTLYFLEDHEIPVVHVTAWVKAGSVYADPEKTGLTSLLSYLLTSGGTKNLTPEEFDRRVDNLAIGLGSDLGAEFGTMQLNTLTSTLPEALPLFFEALFSPRFDEHRLKLGQEHLLESLRREEDNPETYAGIRFQQLIYGKESPWARRPTKKSILKIKQADLREFHQHYFVPANMHVGIAGDFSRQNILREIKKLTDSMPKTEVTFPPVPALELKFKAVTEQINRPLNQSSIRVGHFGVKRHNLDIYALQVMNCILGAGGFKSRLMDEIRVKRGLSYNVRSSFGQGTDYGLFVAGLATKASSTDEALGILQEEISKMAKGEGLTEKELHFAKESMVNKLIFKFESSDQMVNDFVSNRLLGYPDNYWQVYRKKLEAVSLADVRRVAAEYLHPDGLKILILGPKRK